MCSVFNFISHESDSRDDIYQFYNYRSRKTNWKQNKTKQKHSGTILKVCHMISINGWEIPHDFFCLLVRYIFLHISFPNELCLSSFITFSSFFLYSLCLCLVSLEHAMVGVLISTSGPGFVASLFYCGAVLSEYSMFSSI